MSCRHGAGFKDLQLSGSGFVGRTQLADAAVCSQLCTEVQHFIKEDPPHSAPRARRHALHRQHGELTQCRRQQAVHLQLPPCWRSLDWVLHKGCSPDNQTPYAPQEAGQWGRKKKSSQPMFPNSHNSAEVCPAFPGTCSAQASVSYGPFSLPKRKLCAGC